MKKLIYLILIVLIILPFLDGNFEPLNIYGKIYEFILLSLLGLFYYINDYQPIRHKTSKPQKF
jgi:hypothetical protein